MVELEQFSDIKILRFSWKLILNKLNVGRVMQTFFLVEIQLELRETVIIEISAANKLK